MYNNIGKKIKILSEIVCALGIFVSVVFGLYRIDFAIREKLIGTAIEGILWIVIGSIISWITTFALYGFGELIEKVTNIDNKIELPKSKELLTQNNNRLFNDNSLDENMAFCSICGADITYDSTLCHVCGNEIKKK